MWECMLLCVVAVQGGFITRFPSPRNIYAYTIPQSLDPLQPYDLLLALKRLKIEQVPSNNFNSWPWKTPLLKN